MAHFGEPYKKWALGPFSKLLGQQDLFGRTDVSPALIIRIMHIMSGLDVLEEAFGYVIAGKRRRGQIRL
jgi:hypothetical protein